MSPYRTRLLIPLYFLFILLAVHPLAVTQELEFPVSPTPVGSGARAAGMADAFVAIADDATAASWNPAGLVQLEGPEFSFVGAYNGISERFSDVLEDTTSALVSPTQRDNNTDINFVSYTHPIRRLVAGRNSTVSISYQQRYDLSRNYESTNTLRIEPINLTTVTRDDFQQQGQLSTVSLAYAIELTQTLSLGATANFWRDSFISDSGWKQTRRLTSNIDSNGTLSDATEFTQVEFEHFEGENYIIGVLWNFRPQWNLGLRYDTSFKADVDTQSISIRTMNGVETNSQLTDGKGKASFPDTLAIGISCRATDRFTISFDVTRTDWDNLYLENADGDRISMVDNQLLGSDFDVNLKTTTTVRLGMEYVFIPRDSPETLDYLWTLRGGLVYDEEPASGRRNNLLVVDDGDGNFIANEATGKPDAFYGFTFGVGLLAKQRVNFDFAYQYRRGNGVNSDYIQGRRGFEEDVEQHRLLLSTIVYF